MIELFLSSIQVLNANSIRLNFFIYPMIRNRSEERIIIKSHQAPTQWGITAHRLENK